jgi:hypothetical protein
MMKSLKLIGMVILALAFSFNIPDKATAQDADSMVVTETGNVGIGIASPTTKLEVYQGSVYVHGTSGGQYSQQYHSCRDQCRLHARWTPATSGPGGGGAG